MSIRDANIRLELGEPEEGLPEKIASRLGLGAAEVSSWRILRKSLDARSHDDIHFSYSAEVQLPEEVLPRAGVEPSADLQPYIPERFEWPAPGSRPMEHRPVIIGSGPAGLIAGYLLAESGYRPLILERGRAVKDRVADVRRFDEKGPLDPESNYLFGEGGAGTFSDGKLTSRGTGPDVQKVLEILAECHGRPSIVYEHRPHLGSYLLPMVVRTLAAQSSRRRAARSASRAASKTSTSTTAASAACTRRPDISRPTRRSWRSATAPATPTGCCSDAASRSSPSPSS